MDGDLRVCAAAFFRSRGKGVATEKEFLMGVSMDFHWMPYGEAKRVLATMLSDGVLVRSGDCVKPSFDIADVDVPVAYRPPAGLAAVRLARPEPAGGGDLLSDMMSAAEAAGLGRRGFIAECNAVQKSLNVDVTVAGLIVLRDRGADVSGFAERAYAACRVAPSL